MDGVTQTLRLSVMAVSTMPAVRCHFHHSHCSTRSHFKKRDNGISTPAGSDGFRRESSWIAGRSMRRLKPCAGSEVQFLRCWEQQRSCIGKSDPQPPAARRERGCFGEIRKVYPTAGGGGPRKCERSSTVDSAAYFIPWEKDMKASSRYKYGPPLERILAEELTTLDGVLLWWRKRMAKGSVKQEEPMPPAVVQSMMKEFFAGQMV